MIFHKKAVIPLLFVVLLLAGSTIASVPAAPGSALSSSICSDKTSKKTICIRDHLCRCGSNYVDAVPQPGGGYGCSQSCTPVPPEDYDSPEERCAIARAGLVPGACPTYQTSAAHCVDNGVSEQDKSDAGGCCTVTMVRDCELELFNRGYH